MPIPNRRSVYRFCAAIAGADGARYLTEAPPFRYEDLADNIEHTVVAGDSWDSIAERHYGGIIRGGDLEGASLLAKVIADFQPAWVDDPTILPAAGTVIYVPSITTLDTRIFSEARRAEYEG